MVQSKTHDPKSQQYQARAWGLCVVGVIACVLSVCFASAFLSGESDTAMIELENKINPNTAPKASLIRISGVGPSLAEAIIQYRQSYIGQGQAFKCPADLQNVKGIGVKKTEAMVPHLSFGKLE